MESSILFQSKSLLFHWKKIVLITDLVYFTTRALDTGDRSATRATRVRQKSNTNDTSETRATRVKQECYTNDTSAARVKKFDFDNDMNENIFSRPYISYRENERLQGDEQFHFKN